MTDNKAKKKNFDGVRSAAELLAVMEQSNRDRILQQLATKDPVIADKIRQKMFLFEDLLRIEDPGIQLVLKEISKDILILGLRNSSDALKLLIFKNMPVRAGTLLKEELEHQGPKRLSAVTAAQDQIVQTVKRMISEGKIRTK